MDFWRSSGPCALLLRIICLLCNKGGMYCISDAEYLRDFTMMLNDDIIDCFTEKSAGLTWEEKKEIDSVYVEIVTEKKAKAKDKRTTGLSSH